MPPLLQNKLPGNYSPPIIRKMYQALFAGIWLLLSYPLGIGTGFSPCETVPLPTFAAASAASPFIRQVWWEAAEAAVLEISDCPYPRDKSRGLSQMDFLSRHPHKF
jgi:hypothetical protein